MDDSYSNYETRLVSIWIEGKAETYKHYADMYRSLLKVADTKENAIRELAMAIRADVLDGNPMIEGMYYDLINAAAARVEYAEVANSIAESAEA